jgi:hypothetical protein
MKTGWRWTLPLVGLILCGVETYHSIDFNHQMRRATDRYFWWSSVRLDSDPLNRRKHALAACKDEAENCVGWELRDIWVDPGWLERALEISATPAFLLGVVIVGLLGRLGVSEVTSFMNVAPPLIFVWFYFIGWLVDRWKRKRLQSAQEAGAR